MGFLFYRKLKSATADLSGNKKFRKISCECDIGIATEDFFARA